MLAPSPTDSALPLLLRGVLLGLGAAVPIGPVNVELARRVLRGGFFAGFALGCGAVSVDVMYLVLSSLSVTRLLAEPAVATVVGVAGVALLLCLAFLSFRAGARALRTDPLDTPRPDSGDVPPPVSARSGYLTGVLMTLFNPVTLAFWFTVVPGQIPRAGRAGLMVVGAGVFLGTISWVVAFAGLLGWARRYRRKAWLAAADLVGGTILLGFGVAGFLRLVRPFI